MARSKYGTTHQSKVCTLVCRQRRMIFAMRRQFLQDNCGGPRELDESFLPIPLVNIYVPLSACFLCRAQPVFQRLIWLPQVMLRYVRQLCNRPWSVNGSLGRETVG